MAKEKLYKVLELSTQGWSLIENNAQNLTSKQAAAKIQESSKEQKTFNWSYTHRELKHANQYQWEWAEIIK